MSKLDSRVNKLERTDRSHDTQQEGMSEDDLRIIQQLSIVELDLCPDMALVTEADTDPETFTEIQRTLTEARGEFEPEPPLPTPLPSPRGTPQAARERKRRLMGPREADEDSLKETLDFLHQAVADASHSREIVAAKPPSR